MVFKPGQSGNPLGRPTGARNRFSEAYMRDLAETWATYGSEAMQKAAMTEPTKFVAICATLIPKDVSVTLQARLPGNLEPEDWSAFAEVLATVREVLPDASQRRPGEVAELMLTALRSHLSTTLVDSASEGQTETQP